MNQLLKLIWVITGILAGRVIHAGELLPLKTPTSSSIQSNQILSSLINPDPAVAIFVPPSSTTMTIAPLLQSPSITSLQEREDFGCCSDCMVRAVAAVGVGVYTACLEISQWIPWYYKIPTMLVGGVFLLRMTISGAYELGARNGIKKASQQGEGSTESGTSYRRTPTHLEED